MKRIFFLLLFLLTTGLFSQEDSVQTGIASFYAKKFEGRMTAGGQKFSNTELTAAHKYLPFGTKVKVTNLKNNRTVIVTINDRLPQSSKRCIDLTQAAAKKLGFLNAGTAKVSIELMKDE